MNRQGFQTRTSATSKPRPMSSWYDGVFMAPVLRAKTDAFSKVDQTGILKTNGRPATKELPELLKIKYIWKLIRMTHRWFIGWFFLLTHTIAERPLGAVWLSIIFWAIYEVSNLFDPKNLYPRKRLLQHIMYFTEISRNHRNLSDYDFEVQTYPGFSV